ncbi:protein FAR1-RELATED SEQUENCE 5-like [Henckelia pumila]|uniref:protein FAR1-RELATED SEQUENCE 5-like n=1 Tax=Henckelia pumila TaxID=405737 RepID=UPI003C6E79A6
MGLRTRWKETRSTVARPPRDVLQPAMVMDDGGGNRRWCNQVKPMGWDLRERIKDCATVNDGLFEEDNEVVPEVGMKFRSVDEIYEIYKKYTYRMGFPIRRRTSRKGKNGVIRNVAFTCGREGNRSRGATTSLKPSATSQTRCKDRLNAAADAFGVWRVTIKELKHNNEISPSKSRMYRCNRQLTENVKRKLELNDIAGIPLNKSYKSIVVEAGGYENMTFIEKDCRNFIDKSPGFYFSIDYDEDGRLKNVFWADKRCRLAYKELGDVVTFDTKYLTNKYDTSFAPFVGVNHHGKSTLFGFGMIAGEDTDTFVWLFRMWLDCMENQPPTVLVAMVDKYTLHENDWLSGIFNERSWWIPCFLNTSFWAGMSSMQRSESMNAFFDGAYDIEHDPKLVNLTVQVFLQVLKACKCPSVVGHVLDNYH